MGIVHYIIDPELSEAIMARREAVGFWGLAAIVFTVACVLLWGWWRAGQRQPRRKREWTGFPIGMCKVLKIEEEPAKCEQCGWADSRAIVLWCSQCGAQGRLLRDA